MQVEKDSAFEQLQSVVQKRIDYWMSKRKDVPTTRETSSPYQRGQNKENEPNLNRVLQFTPEEKMHSKRNKKRTSSCLESSYEESDSEDVKTPVMKKRKLNSKKEKAIRTPEDVGDSARKKMKDSIQKELETAGPNVAVELAKVLEILNRGDVKQLQELHGIGKKRANDIVDYRAGTPFESVSRQEAMCEIDK